MSGNGTPHRLGIPVVVAAISMLLTIGGVIVYAGGTLQQIKAHDERITTLEQHEHASPTPLLMQRISALEARLAATDSTVIRTREALLDRMAEEARKQQQTIDTLNTELRKSRGEAGHD